MEDEIKNKINRLMTQTRVITLAVSYNDIPWSSPVYFVFYNNGFYFFSNKNSRHIQYAENKKILSGSIFQDADQMDQIFGVQMSGKIERVSKLPQYLTIVKKYIEKFSFLEKIFGPQIIKNNQFFLEKFKSHLYCFYPDIIFLSDNAKTTEKRSQLDLNEIF